MPPLHRDYIVSGPHTLKGGRLTFKTGGALLGSEARQAMIVGKELTVTLMEPGGLKDVTGKVLSVELVKGAKPAQWEIVIKVAKGSER
jgi:hypothetical protein